MKRLIQWYRQLKLAGKGEDVYLGRNVHITRPHLCTIGSHSAIDDGFYCTTKLHIRDYCHVSAYVTVIGGKETGLWLKGFNTIGPGCKIICGSDLFLGDGLTSVIVPQKYRGSVKIAPVIMERFSSICASVVVAPGVRISEGSVVGAGSLLMEDTEPWWVYWGTPARPQKKRMKRPMFDKAREMGYYRPSN